MDRRDPLRKSFAEATKGKLWCGTELVRARTGSRRAPDVHPMQWWLMSTSARLLAQGQWKVKFKEIQQAQSRRAIDREPLDKMPKQSIPEAPPRYESGSAMLLLSKDYLTEASAATSAAIGTSQIDDNDSADDHPPTLVNESSDEDISKQHNWETS